MTDNKNKKREDGATERAQEIVDSLFGKNTSAKSAGSQKDLADDTAGRMAAVAGRAVGKVALGFSKGMRAISANNSAKNKGATPTKRKRNTVTNEVNSVKRRSVKSSSASRTRVVKADWGEVQSVSDEITRPIDEEIIFGTDKTQVLSDATQVLSSEGQVSTQKTQVLTGGGKASSQKTQILSSEDKVSSQKEQAISTDEVEEEKQELSSEEAESEALSEAQDQAKGAKDAEGVDGAEDAEGDDGAEGAEGASQETEAVGDETSEDGETKAKDAEIDAEGAEGTGSAEGAKGAEATKGAGSAEADAEDEDAKSDSEDAKDDTDDASAEPDTDADGALSDTNADEVEDDEVSDGKNEEGASEEELEEFDEDSEEKPDSSEQDSDEEISEEDDAEDGEDTAEDTEEASEDSEEDTEDGTEDSEEDTEEAEEDDSEEDDESEDSQDSEDDSEATDDDAEEDEEEEEDDSILSSRRKASPSKRGRATTSVSAGSVVSSLVRAPLNRRHAKKEAWESSKASRRSVLEDADYTSSYKAYQKMLTKGGARKSGVLRGLHNTPGCYAIATYPPKLKWDRDLASYTDIYVGMAERVGEGVLECCSCHGCADVYADIKYKQNVHVFIYACDEDDLEQLQVELIEILGADKSYNANI